MSVDKRSKQFWPVSSKFDQLWPSLTDPVHNWHGYIQQPWLYLYSNMLNIIRLQSLHVIKMHDLYNVLSRPHRIYPAMPLYRKGYMGIQPPLDLCRATGCINTASLADCIQPSMAEYIHPARPWMYSATAAAYIQLRRCIYSASSPEYNRGGAEFPCTPFYPGNTWIYPIFYLDMGGGYHFTTLNTSRQMPWIYPESCY